MKILHNVLVLTMDEKLRVANSLAWEGPKLFAVGAAEELFRRYPDAEKIDGEGHTVLPGFIDPHQHFIWGILFNGILSCTPDKAPTIESLKHLLNNSSKDRRKGEWIVAQGYDPLEFEGWRMPTRHDLDEACPDNPAVLIHYSMHECVANSMALEAAGIDRNTKDPFGGTIKRDSKGDPTGHLIELAMTEVEKLARKNLIEQTGEKLVEMMKDAQDLLLSLGITRICDTAVSPELEAIYRDAFNMGKLKIPIVMNPSSETGLYELPWDSLHHRPTGEKNGLLTVGPLKMYFDGANQCGIRINLLEFLVAALVTNLRMIKSFSADPLITFLRSESHFGRDLRIHTGLFTSSPKNYHKLSSMAVNNCLAIAIHAIGNEAIEYAVNVIRSVRDKHIHNPPPRIDHALFLNDRLIKQIADLGIVIVTQPYFLTHMHSSNIPYLAGMKQMPLRSLIKSGVRVSGSSDWPVATNNPLLAIERAVTRRTRGDETLQIDEALNVNEALTLYTRDAAYAIGCGNEAGSLEAGKQADFIMISEDPFQLHEEEWGKVKVKKTYISGELVFSAE